MSTDIDAPTFPRESSGLLNILNTKLHSLHSLNAFNSMHAARERVIRWMIKRVDWLDIFRLLARTERHFHAGVPSCWRNAGTAVTSVGFPTMSWNGWSSHAISSICCPLPFKHTNKLTDVWSHKLNKALGETQTLRAGCSKAEPKNFGPPQTPSRGRRTAKI